MLWSTYESKLQRVANFGNSGLSFNECDGYGHNNGINGRDDAADFLASALNVCDVDGIAWIWAVRAVARRLRKPEFEAREKDGSRAHFADCACNAPDDDGMRRWNWYRFYWRNRNSYRNLHPHCDWNVWIFATLASPDSHRAVGVYAAPLATGRSSLVAGHHVLGYALQADDRVADQGQAPELVVVFTHVVGSEDGDSALG